MPCVCLDNVSFSLNLQHVVFEVFIENSPVTVS